MIGSSGSHYSCAFNLDEMRKFCMKAGDELKSFSDSKKCDIVFIYSGMSGVATATALSHILYFEYSILAHMVYVRKRFEEAHGNTFVEYSQNKNVYSKYAIFFVDDLIDSGETRKRSLRTAFDWAPIFEGMNKEVNQHKDIGNILMEGCLGSITYPRKCFKL